MTNAAAAAAARRRLFLVTKRKDRWWVAPLLTFLGLSAFILYSTWAAFQGDHYWSGPYLSPFYAPELFGNSPHALFGPPPSWWPSLLPFSPALLILWAPAGFRFTCYYYRGAYYKAFWGDPPSCMVGEPRKTYLGERWLPLVLQNVHRYFLYLAVVFIFLLAWDAYKAFWFADGFGIGLGTLVLCANVTLLGSYTFGCHSMRHLTGGRKDELPKSTVGRACYDCASSLNRRHMIFAWCSLFSVGLSDVYVRLCSMGVITDLRLL
ncbi:MAG: succinate dehydrogenase [Deltaproteobacteria bacterium]|nr:succinate dehydrogenase [Deltaproteobacteria bacterium]